MKSRSAPPAIRKAPAEVRQTIQAVDSALPVTTVRTLRNQVDRQLEQQQLMATLAGLFSILALVLAAVGLYGVLAYWVGQRAREIGVRLALGAQAADVVRLVLSRGALVALTGIGAGVLSALASTRLLRSVLYGVTPTDPVTFAAASMLVAGVALFACLIPARRATRVDPAVALRHE